MRKMDETFFKQPLFNNANSRTFLKIAIEHYEGAPGWFTDWLEAEYIRLWEAWDGITLDEIVTISRLYEEGTWMSEYLACNTIYKLLDRLNHRKPCPVKYDLSGIIGY